MMIIPALLIHVTLLVDVSILLTLLVLLRMLATTLHAIFNSDVSKLIYLIPVMTMMLAIPIHATTL
jgi:hypothetical protein